MQIEDKTLFQLQAELIDTKVELAVNKAINQVVEQIINLRHEVHVEISGLKHEMIERFSKVENKVENRLSAVETALGMRNEVRGEIRTRFFDLTYKLGALVAVAALANIPFVLTQIRPLFQ